MRIFLIRHGRQSDSRCNVNVGLAEEGVRQAELVAARMKHMGIATLVSSDLIRARETAAIIQHELNLPLTIEPALRELDFGDMHGLTDEQIADQYADFQTAQARLEMDLQYPGGENAANVLQRAVPALRQTIDTADPSGPLAIVTHGVVIRCLSCFAVNAPLARWRTLSSGLENCSITELKWNPDTHTLSLERLNDYAHLEAHPELLRAAWGVNEN